MILIINDLHISERPPVGRRPDYLKDIVGKLLECVTIANAYCDIVVFTGDMFHQKAARSVSHKVVRVLIAVLKKFKMKPYLIYGNHDIMGGEVRSGESQPIGVILESGVARHLNVVENDKYELVGVDYDERFELGEKIYALGGAKKKRLVFAHASLYGGSSLRENIKGDFDYCFYGHAHWDEGQIGKFVNYGSLARVSRDSYNRRLVRVAMLENGGKVKPIVLARQRPWQEVFLVKKDAGKIEDDSYDDFIYALENFEVDNLAALDEALNACEPKVKQRVQYYIGAL